mmetsp:Transcript_10211/g.19987  ORF Transcript_10211/g.19987 Transcript_10211/m.19987 type:complete len:242 (-) Transcript_10211:79-804(-)
MTSRAHTLKLEKTSAEVLAFISLMTRAVCMATSLSRSAISLPSKHSSSAFLRRCLISTFKPSPSCWHLFTAALRVGYCAPVYSLENHEPTSRARSSAAVLSPKFPTPLLQRSTVKSWLMKTSLSLESITSISQKVAPSSWALTSASIVFSGAEDLAPLWAMTRDMSGCSSWLFRSSGAATILIGEENEWEGRIDWRTVTDRSTWDKCPKRFLARIVATREAVQQRLPGVRGGSLGRRAEAV